jgi:hypothetical protein
MISMPIQQGQEVGSIDGGDADDKVFGKQGNDNLAGMRDLSDESQRVPDKH